MYLKTKFKKILQKIFYISPLPDSGVDLYLLKDTILHCFAICDRRRTVQDFTQVISSYRFNLHAPNVHYNYAIFYYHILQLMKFCFRKL